jgi:hypothetical protein
MMITTDPRDMLALSEQRSAQFQADAAAERLREPSAVHRGLARFMRRAADRLDAAPRAWQPTQTLPGGGR